MTIEIRPISRRLGFAAFSDAARVTLAAVTAIVIARRRRYEVMRLSEMSDHHLKDLGLRRDDVHEALNTGWREDPTYRLAVAAARARRAGRV